MRKSLVETRVRHTLVYRGNAVDFVVDTVRLPNGRSAEREYLDHPGAVGVLPLKGSGAVVMVRQYRHPVGELTYEIPAGKLSRGESPLACARRELNEETGFTARRIRKLLSYWPTPAFANEVLHLYVAEGLVPGRLHPDDDEFLESVEIPFDRALRWALSGRIRDSKTVIALLAWARRRNG